MKSLSASVFITVLLVISVVTGCKKEQVICIACNTPLVRYAYISGIDTLTYDYTLLGSYRAYVDSYFTSHGYIVYIDTLWNDTISYNECFDNKTYQNSIYPEAPQYYNRYCKIKQ